MKPEKVILDTGPLVAFLNKQDNYHNWAIEQFSFSYPPFFTCEAVISEACFLLRNYKNGIYSVLELIERDLLKIPFCLKDEISSISTLLNKYKDVPMSLADACIVRLSEQISNSFVCTLDSDFKIYRKNKRNIIKTIMPLATYLE